MAAPISRFAEEISILVLALWGIAGEPFLRARLTAATPVVACCPDIEGSQQLAARPRGLVIRVLGVPFGFEVSAAVGSDKPFIFTLYSAPGARVLAPRPRSE